MGRRPGLVLRRHGLHRRNLQKMTFAKGADPQGLLNASLDGNVRRAFDFSEGAPIDKAALNKAGTKIGKTPAHD